MSDLAPFVAAALRDQVVAEMREENDKLREQVRKSRTVAITGPRGTPVYCQAQFDEGGYNDNPNLWKVDFGLPLARCPLAALMDVEVRIGGMCKAKLGNNTTVEGFFDDGLDLIAGGWGQMSFCFGELWLQVLLGPFPSEEVFRELAATADDDNLAFHHYLSGDFAAEYPNISAIFVYTSFFVSSVNGIIQSLSLDPAVEEDAQRRREELAEEIQRDFQRMQEAPRNEDEGTDE